MLSYSFIWCKRKKCFVPFPAVKSKWVRPKLPVCYLVLPCSISVPSKKAWEIAVGCLQSTSTGTVEDVPSSGCNATKCLQNSERAECSPKLLCQGWCMRHQISSTSCPHLFPPHTHTLQSYSHSADISILPRNEAPITFDFTLHPLHISQSQKAVSTNQSLHYNQFCGHILIPGMVCYYIFPFLNIT